MKVDVILGLQWGDEGKGKFVDALSSNYAAVARFHGGSNAGHTLIFQGKKIVLNSLPSGILDEKTMNIIGAGVVLDLASFRREIEMLGSLGYDIRAAKNLKISKKAHLILPTHALLDKLSEEQLGDEKIGSTQKGIGPAYADKVQRRGIRAEEVLLEGFEESVQRLLQIHAAEIKQKYGKEIPLKDLFEHFIKDVTFLKTFDIIDTELFANNMLTAGKTILAEGAQATMLDVDHGTYPFVTSSSCVAGSACTGLGIAPKHIGEVFGIFKAYCTRVGNGPFPSELDEDIADQIRIKGQEFGSVTKRPRRIGWLDLPALKYAIMINGVSQLIMTKADVLSEFDTIKVFKGYANDVESGKDRMLFEEFESWPTGLEEIKSTSKLPATLKSYMAYLEEELNVPITYLSTGPDREQIVSLS
ncbi:adenylosuccinate synthase [Sphingobacterium sp. LRF_L2]|uniref:adenylosuccinate synthase n=1 Tax=Sphingobacterium sp. LRF_L2 TaxID=3369421 RepID=UPI003F5E8EA9